MTCENSNNQKAKFIPYLFFIFFGVIVVVDSIYIYIANKTWRGLSTENAYQKGLDYNQTIADKERQKKLGWSLKTKINYLQKNNYLLTVTLSDKDQNQIKDAKITIRAIRPVQEGFDFNQELKLVNNSYQAIISFPLKGQWDIEYHVTKNNSSFEQTNRYVIDESN